MVVVYGSAQLEDWLDAHTVEWQLLLQQMVDTFVINFICSFKKWSQFYSIQNCNAVSWLVISTCISTHIIPTDCCISPCFNCWLNFIESISDCYYHIFWNLPNFFCSEYNKYPLLKPILILFYNIQRVIITTITRRLTGYAVIGCLTVMWLSTPGLHRGNITIV